MSSVRFDNVAFGFTDPLFKDVNLSIGSNDRIGIVGNNGCGKSTFLKCLAGLIEPQKGHIHATKGTKFGFIEQDIPAHLQNYNLYDVISAVLPAEEKIYSGWKVNVCLDVLKAPETIRQKAIKELSGGWQRLALIARLTLSQSDILLLDEPTNHLDVAKILVLEQWLNEQVHHIPLITISHDRNFLANCTHKTFFLRESEIIQFNYSYNEARKLLFELDQASIAKRTKEIKEMNRLKKSAHDLRQIGVNNYSDAALKKSLQIAKRANEIENQLTPIPVTEKRNIKLSSSGIQAKRLINIKNFDVCTPQGDKLFYIENLDIKEGDRLFIFGENGSGKSQFLKAIQKALFDKEAAKGIGITVSSNIKQCYIDQHLSFLPLQKNVRDCLNDEFALGEQKTTTVLINAGFPLAQHRTKLELLSFGQRTRLAFLMLNLQQPNLYILDEPTNHLDITGQENLESEIIEQNVTSIIVSHDRAFAKNVGTTYYVIKNKQLISIDTPDLFYNDIINAKFGSL